MLASNDVNNKEPELRIMSPLDTNFLLARQPNMAAMSEYKFMSKR